MRFSSILLALLTLCAIGLSACLRMTDPAEKEPRPDPSLNPVQNAGDLAPTMVIFDLYASDISEPEEVQKYAKADLVVLNDCNVWCTSQSIGLVDRLKAANPDLKVLNYTRAKTAPCDIDFEHLGRDWHPYLYDWWNSTRPYWCWTTEGDTAMEWPGEVILNITDPGCRQAIVNVIASFQASEPNKVDGVLWDYFPEQLYIVPAADQAMQGDPDLDGDGIGHWDDPDEMAAFRAGEAALVQDLRAALGNGFIQIFNGNLARVDSTFAALGDGILYERFPTVGFGSGANMANALDPNRFNNLFAARHWPRNDNGGPWLILANKWGTQFRDDQGDLIEYNLADINRVVALMTDCAVVYNPHGEWGYAWPEVELSLGEALGGVERDGQVMTRRFEHGSVTLTMTSGQFPLPFDFQIEQAGRIVQLLDPPYHIP
jgi:hypothetical protein